MKTILYVDHTAKLGGGEIALIDLIAAIDKTIFKPIVLLSSDGPLTSRLRNDGVETHILPLSRYVVELRKDSLDLHSITRTRDIITVFAYARRLGKWAKQHKVDIIHTNSLKADICGGIAGRLTGIPVVWHVRDSIAAPYLPARVAALFRLLARLLPKAIITNSNSTMSTLSLPPNKMNAVVYSGITPGNGIVAAPTMNGKSHDTATPILGSRSHRPIISLIGRIAEWKGQHILVGAASKVLKSYPNAEFWIVGAPLFGEKEYEQKLRDQIASLGVSESVKLLGFRDDVPSIIEQSTVVVHASIIGEPFGQVVVQGMAAGKPVIATDGAAVPEIVVGGETGLLVPMGDIDAMAEGIVWLLDHPAEATRMGDAARVRANECFSISQSAAAVESLYCRMLGSSPVSD